MALMVLPDPGRALVEMTRLLGVGGRLVLLVPTTAPLTVRDRVRYVRLLTTLRASRFPFRHQQVLDEPRRLLEPAGLSLVSDERRRFAYPFATPDDALLWARSLYLPDRTEPRLHAARQLTRRWVGTTIGIPLRRLVATRNR